MKRPRATRPPRLPALAVAVLGLLLAGSIRAQTPPDGGPPPPPPEDLQDAAEPADPATAGGEPVDPQPGEPTPAPVEEETAAAGEGRIGKIFVDGNVRVSDAAFFSNLRVKPGDPFDERGLQDEFRRLWELGLFDDLIVESRQRSPGVVDLIFHVQDRPLVTGVAFVGMKAVTESLILERLSQAKADVRRGQPIDFSLLKRAESAIEHLLAEKGYLEARVRSRLTTSRQGQRDITFYIREGSKTRIKSIAFTGNTVFNDRRLRKMLKLTKQAFWLTSWASSKNLYHPAKFDQDAEGIRAAYRSGGYLDVKVQPEIVEVQPAKGRKGRRGGPPAADVEETEEDAFWEPPAPAAPPSGETEKQRRKRVKAELEARRKEARGARKFVHLTVPIEEGPQYRVGEIEVEGNTVFSTREIMARMPLRSGGIFNEAAMKAGAKRLEEDYGERGYFYVSIDPQISRRETSADLKLSITEDRKYFVDRIEFTGNTTTRDGVLRREMPLYEEDLFNVRRMRLGVRKIAQLGYFQIGQDPVVKPQPGSDRVDIEIQGIESSRNEIQVGGGVSGIEGGFFQASYATRNFLGRGEIFSLFLQAGSRADRYSINFTEPWFLGKPWTLGFSVFRRQSDYVGFRRLGSGGSLVLGRLLGHFGRFDVAYGYETVDFLPSRAGFGSSTTTSTSSLTAIYTIDTRNNYFRPTRGYRLQTALEYAGSFLGGDNWFVKPRVEGTLYLPGFARRHYIGLNAAYSYVRGLGDRDVPFFERFYLGGERSLRVFRTREVSPSRRDLDVNGNGRIDFPEDLDGDGVLDPREDLNGNGTLDTEDLNRNGVLDPGEDGNGNGALDTEDLNGNGALDAAEDLLDGVWTPFCPPDDPNMDGNQLLDPDDPGNQALEPAVGGNCVLDPGEDTNGDGVFGTVFPGGNQYVLFNAEYTISLTDTVEFSLFYDAGNAFDDGQRIALDDMRVDYGLEMRFHLPVFQAPLRLIYGFIQNPRPGEDASNFIFSIGSTF